MKKTFSRRNFLLQAGTTGLVLPFLPSLLPNALALNGKPPKRFIAVAHRYGHHGPQFFPTNPGPMNKLDDNTFYSRLSDIQGPISRILNEKFDPYRAKMNVYWGLDSIGGGGHNSTVPLQGGGYTNGEGEDSPPKFGKSIDVLMMKSPNVYPTISRFEAIRIARGSVGVSWDRGSDGVAQRLSYMSGNKSIFDTVFGGVTAGADASNQRQQLIIDKIFERYKALRNNPRMSTVDRNRFENHIASVTEVQKRIQSQGVCSVPKFTAPTGTVAAEILWRNNIDILVSAMSCDMTRVGALHIYDFEFGTVNNYQLSHGNSHDRESNNPAAREIAAGYSAFKADQILYLLQRLNGIIESDGSTMLDNTVILWTAELTNGNFHVASCLPLATFGSAGGALKTGYLMDFRLKPIRYLAGRSDFLAPLGQSYNRLLITLMRAMGMQPSEYLNEGDGGGFGEFKKDINYITNEYTQFISQRNNPLPIVFG
jgi:hypothetical protein